MGSSSLEVSVGGGNFDFILLIISLAFTVGVIVTLILITRHVMKSKWIDSNSVGVLFFAVGLSLLLLAALWVTYLLYVGIL
ncbi:TPA: hypothetical protein EYG96_02910 [Candidatus Gracilibacteria bacterium]|nr:hypothetical protein [Candidatus Gracilibacteria bacterium]